MLQALISSVSLSRVLDEQVANEVFSFLGDVSPFRVREIVIAFNNLLKQSSLG